MSWLSWIHEWFTGARRKRVEAQLAQWIEERKGCECARCRMRRGGVVAMGASWKG